MALFTNIGNLIGNVFDELGRALEPNPHDPTGTELVATWPDDSERARWTRRHDVHVAQTTAGRGPSREELERVAAIYRDHHGGAPLEAVAKLLSVSRSTAARRVARARELGLLPPIGAGNEEE